MSILLLIPKNCNYFPPLRMEEEIHKHTIVDGLMVGELFSCAGMSRYASTWNEIKRVSQ